MRQIKLFETRQSRTNRGKVMVTVEQIREAYSKAVAEGNNIEQLANQLGLKVTSLTQRLTTLRNDLREAGVTDTQIKVMLPPLTRRTGPRSSKRKEAIAAMVAEAKAIEIPAN